MDKGEDVIVGVNKFQIEDEADIELLKVDNQSVRTQLAAGDVRANYVQVGSIWTTTPAGSGDAPVPDQTGDQTAQMRGSLTLSNCRGPAEGSPVNAFAT